jgi:hypothetical protein
MEIPEHRSRTHSRGGLAQHPGAFADRRSEDYLQELLEGVS